MTNLIKFVPGRSYYQRMTGDSNLKVTIKVVSRTEKSVRIIDDNNRERTLRINVYRDVEQVFPEGRHSFATIIGADRELPPDLPTTEQLERQANEAAERRRQAIKRPDALGQTSANDD